MRGAPVIELVLIFLLFGGAVYPLLRLTADREFEQDSSLHVNAGEEIGVFGTLQFAHTPSLVVVRQGESVLLNVEGGDKEFDFEFRSASDGCDLELEVAWPEGNDETALELSLEPEGQETLRFTFWGDEEVYEILNVSWEADDHA